MRQAGQQAARVAGGDAVAVGVLNVGKAAVGVVGRDLAVQFRERVAAAGAGGQRAVVAGLGEVAAAAVGLEPADRTARLVDIHGAVRIHGDVRVPGVSPAPAEPAGLVPVENRRAEGPSEAERESGRGDLGVGGAGQAGKRAVAAGLLDLEAEQLADVGARSRRCRRGTGRRHPTSARNRPKWTPVGQSDWDRSRSRPPGSSEAGRRLSLSDVQSMVWVL